MKIVWGREDRILPVGLAAPLQKLIPGSQLHILENCGHLPHAEKVDEFVDIVCR